MQRRKVSEFKHIFYQQYSVIIQISKDSFNMSSQNSYQERFMRWMNEMHFDSQPAAAHLYKGLILAVGIISYVIAFFFQRFSICVYSVLVAMVISIIVVVPGGWPWWQKPLPPFAKEKSS